MVLNKMLKGHAMKSGLFLKLPPASSIIASMVRLTGVGTLMLTGGVLCGVFMPVKPETGGGHFLAAVAVWFVYIGLLTIWQVRGMTPTRMSLSVIATFVVSLIIFTVA